MERSSLKMAMALIGGVVMLGAAGQAAKSADKPITVGLIMEARPEVEPWSLAWHDAAEAMKKKDPSIKVIESYEAYDWRAPSRSHGRCSTGRERPSAFDLRAQRRRQDARTRIQAGADGGVFVRRDDAAEPLLNHRKLSGDGLLELLAADQNVERRPDRHGRRAKVPFETEQMEGCKVGAVAANPNAKIVLVNSNSFTDTQANREQVKGLLDQGITEINLMSGTEDAVGGLRLCEFEQRPLHHMGWRCAFLGTQINRDNHGPRLGRGHGRTGEAGPQR